jgi:hypothetical protein
MILVRYKNNINVLLLENEEKPIVSKGQRVFLRQDGSEVDMETVDIIVQAAINRIRTVYGSLSEIFDKKNILYTDQYGIGTMATDGVNIFINPAWTERVINLVYAAFGGDDPDADDATQEMAEEKAVSAITYVLIHECLHIVFDHCYEYDENKDKYKGDFDRVNIAQDMEINYVIENYFTDLDGAKEFEGVTSILKGMFNKEYGDRGMRWDAIYDELKKQKIKTSEDWKKGFSDAYNKVLKDLRNKHLIEHYDIR